MRAFILIALLQISCSELSPLPEDHPEPDIPHTKIISFPCGQFNGSDDWVTCTPVSLDLSEYTNLSSAQMTYILATTRGSSYMIAELYNVTTGQSILLSQVTSTGSPTIYSKPRTGNILDYLPQEPSEIVIRFRNSKPGPVGYINNNSYLTLFYN